MSDPNAHDDHNHGNGMVHIMSIPMLLGTFFALLFFTWLTVFLADQVQLGKADIWVAMTIATIKATLVGAYFMHLRYEKPFNVTIFLFCLFFVSLFLGAALLDASNYEYLVEQYQGSQSTGP